MLSFHVLSLNFFSYKESQFFFIFIPLFYFSYFKEEIMNKRNISDRAGGSSRMKPIINNEKRKKNEDTTKRTNQKRSKVDNTIRRTNI